MALTPTPSSEYWLGIGLGELSDIVKEQLGLKGGLVVADVLADSPAAKAEFKKNDILIKVGDKALSEPAELMKAVEEAKEGELSVTLLRGGKELTIKVTPAKRPTPEIEARVVETAPGVAPELRDEIKRLEEALKSLKDKAGGEGLGIFFAHPGVVASKDVTIKAGEFPKNMSISVTKNGDQPAKIHVTKGDKEWDVTEDKLSELPDDVRPQVHRFFGGLWGPGLKEMADRMRVGGPKVPSYSARPITPGVAPVPPQPVTPPLPAPQPAEPSRTGRAFQYRIETRGSDDKLDEIMKELKQLRKEVDELRNEKK